MALTLRARTAGAALMMLVGTLHGCGDFPLDGDGEHELEAEPVDDGSNILLQGIIDCSERADTGYRNGSPFSITVVTVDGKPVEKRTANAYYVMQQAAARDGVRIRIVSGFRTMAEQRYLYSCYTNCNCNSCNLAARPGYSNHQSGHALDLNTSEAAVYNWLSNNGGRFGFERTVPSERWHWEWWSGGPGGGPCGSGGGGSSSSSGGTATAGRVVGVTYNAAEGTTARLTGATVKLLRNTTVVATTTSSDTGFWSFTAGAGDYTVVATKSGFAEARRDVTAAGSGDTWGSIGLTPAVAARGTYRGVVYVGPAVGENPLAGATVTLSSGQSAVTSATGAFLFELPAGDITATARKDGYTPASVTRTVNSGAVTWGSIKLTANAAAVPEEAPVPEPPASPVPLFPAEDASVDGTAVTLRWSRVPYGTPVTYELELYANDVTGTPVVALTAPPVTVPEASVTLPMGLQPGIYGWRVRAMAGTVEGAWSPAARFNALGVAPEAPVTGGETEEPPPEGTVTPEPDPNTNGTPPPVNTEPQGDNTSPAQGPFHCGNTGAAGGLWMVLLVLVRTFKRR